VFARRVGSAIAGLEEAKNLAGKAPPPGSDPFSHIVTVPHDILKKLVELGGKDLDDVSLDTVRRFHQDAVAAGFKL
jgi:hypothetical protein